MRFLGLMLIQHPHRRPTRTVGASAENSRLKNCRVCVLLRDARAVLVQAMDTDGCLRNRQVSVKWITMSLPIMRKPKTYRWQRLSTGYARHSLRSIRTLKQNTGETETLTSTIFSWVNCQYLVDISNQFQYLKLNCCYPLKAYTLQASEYRLQ